MSYLPAAKMGRRFIYWSPPMPNFDKDNRFRGSFCVVMDITERKHAEESLGRADRSLLSGAHRWRTASLHTATMALQKELP
ncbi:MAG: hypothetical protein R2932_49150 [Caldilineaceae bacterium]